MGIKMAGINRGSDGKYRWRYEMSLFKNPTILILVWKIFFFIFLGIFAFVTVIDFQNHDPWWESFVINGRVFLIVFAVMTGVVILGYLLYAAIMGGKYIVDFTMDEKGILHRQSPAQAEKARKTGRFTAAVGAASGRPTVAGIGLNSTRTEMSTDFSRVRSVRVYPRRSLIKVNERFSKNQVYASKDDFEFVLGFILKNVPKEAKVKHYIF